MASARDTAKIATKLSNLGLSLRRASKKRGLSAPVNAGMKLHQVGRGKIASRRVWRVMGWDLRVLFVNLGVLDPDGPVQQPGSPLRTR